VSCKVNVMSTHRLRAPAGEDSNDTDLTAKNTATIYWNRESNLAYKAVVEIYKSNPNIVRDPVKESLCTFAMRYTEKWRLRPKLEKKVPHVTPNFKTIPVRSGKNQARYEMFLRSVLLVHKAGTTFDGVSALSLAQLETEASEFTMSPECPKLVAEEFDLSQKEEEEGDEDGGEAGIAEEEDLLVHADYPQEPVQQENWQALLGQVHEEPHVEDGEGDYGNVFNMYSNYDWQEDSRLLGREGITEQDKLFLRSWIKMTKCLGEVVDKDDTLVGGLPGDLNPKQQLAYQIICDHIDGIIDDKANKTSNTPQLLLNISGAAGTGKSFWLNTVRRYAKSQPLLHRDFIKSAVPSGTAAFLIGRETLHGLLRLPTGAATLQPQAGSPLADLQQRFKHVGVLVIDEKSMMGQKVFYFLNKRLQEARPEKADQPFGGLSLVLLGDWKQLPPVLDTPLYQDPSVPRGKTAAARQKDLEKKAAAKGQEFKAQAYQLFELCQRTQQPSLTFRLVGGSMFGLWPLFHLRDGGKWTEMTATHPGVTLRH
jgi:hypothetical protein